MFQSLNEMGVDDLTININAVESSGDFAYESGTASIRATASEWQGGLLAYDPISGHLEAAAHRPMANRGGHFERDELVGPL